MNIQTLKRRGVVHLSITLLKARCPNSFGPMDSHAMVLVIGVYLCTFGMLIRVYFPIWGVFSHSSLNVSLHNCAQNAHAIPAENRLSRLYKQSKVLAIAARSKNKSLNVALGGVYGMSRWSNDTFLWSAGISVGTAAAADRLKIKTAFMVRLENQA